MACNTLHADVVYHTIPTSNHNLPAVPWFRSTVVYHNYSYIKPQIENVPYVNAACCISYYSYIKPQPERERKDDCVVVYHTIPTSNHNCMQVALGCPRLYIILFLHQTTTSYLGSCCRSWLYIVLFLHQTTTVIFISSGLKSCISYYSYIKPQLFP